MLMIETGLVLLSLLIAFIYPSLGSHCFQKIEWRLFQISRRQGVSVITVGVSALALRAALLPVLPIPKPGVHDEFSYLLMADTFSHGRLTNPTHPMWVHFESFHINQKPTYSSIYYPAQGIFLAAGQVFFRNPFWGVWLSSGLMCAAVCWMLQGWLASYWALIGGILAVIRLGTFSYWVNSYWGGTVAALGGALVLGALPRIQRHQRVRDALLMGFGLALLANSRPYEGMFFSVPVIFTLLAWIVRRRGASFRKSVQQVAIPLALILCAAAAGMLYYFWRTTGSPFHTPYLINLATYNPVPFFPWKAIRPWPEYHHSIMQRFYSGWSLNMYLVARQHPFLSAIVKIEMLGFFFLGPLLTLPFIMLGFVLPQEFSFKDIGRKSRLLLVIACVTLFGILLPIFANPHYAAPLVCVIYALLVLALQRIRHWRCRRRPSGLAIVRSVPTIAILLLVLCATAPFLHIQNGPVPETWCSSWPNLQHRAKIQAELERSPGRQLALVHYSLRHNPMEGWVYNAADIDGSKLVWANDMGPQQNEELIDYFKDRNVSLIEPDAAPARISVYTGAPQESTADDSR
jgi:hypothetical protein